MKQIKFMVGNMIRGIGFFIIATAIIGFVIYCIFAFFAVPIHLLLEPVDNIAFFTPGFVFMFCFLVYCIYKVGESLR